jgi:hypothetical protein
MKQHKINYKVFTYWVTVEEVIHTEHAQVQFHAFVSDVEPNGYYGYLVKAPNGLPYLFPTPEAALINANAVKQSELDAKG